MSKLSGVCAWAGEGCCLELLLQNQTCHAAIRMLQGEAGGLAQIGRCARRLARAFHLPSVNFNSQGLQQSTCISFQGVPASACLPQALQGCIGCTSLTMSSREQKALQEKGIGVGDTVRTAFRGGVREG